MFQRFTRVLVPAASYDLIDLATVKDELSLKSVDTSKDKFLARAISQASTSIATYCDRIFQVETVCDAVKQSEGKPFCLSRRPVVALKEIEFNWQSLVEGIDFDLDRETGIFTWRRYPGHLCRFGDEGSIRISYSAGMTVLMAQASAIPSSSPFTIGVTNAQAFAADEGVTKADGTPLQIADGTVEAGEYSQSGGIYTFAAADAGTDVVITYRFAKIKDDIIDAALRLITMQFTRRGRDPLLMSQNTPSLGEQRWWVGGTASQDNCPFPPEIAGLLDHYRMPAVG